MLHKKYQYMFDLFVLFIYHWQTDYTKILFA